MNNLLLIASFIFCVVGFSQSDNSETYYQAKIKELGFELEILEDLQKDYELAIDSLYNLTLKDSTNMETQKLMVDYYILRSENMKSEMKQMVLLIDSLVSAKKEDE
jgi:hypothetical protein